MENEKLITLRVNARLKDAVVSLASAQDRTTSATIRRAIREYVERNRMDIHGNVSTGDGVNSACRL